jgi:hypothetical protein
MHAWSEGDDLAALYVFRFGTTGIPYSVETIARRRGIEPGSFNMGVRNFKAIAGRGGLSHARANRRRSPGDTGGSRWKSCGESPSRSCREGRGRSGAVRAVSQLCGLAIRP